MANRLDAVSVRKYESNGEQKTQYTNLGVAWPFKDKEGFTLRLNAMPAPTEGEYVILLVPPKPKDSPSKSQSSQRQSKPSGSMQNDLDDDIPW